MLNDYITAQASSSSDKEPENPKQQEPQESSQPIQDSTEASNIDKSAATDAPIEESPEQEQEDAVEQEKIQIQLIQFDKEFFAFKLD